VETGKDRKRHGIKMTEFLRNRERESQSEEEKVNLRQRSSQTRVSVCSSEVGR
jgi:hypothetical protein